MSVMSVLEQWEGEELVPLPALTRALQESGAAGMDRGSREYAIRQGVITPAAGGGHGRPFMVTWEDALLIALAAVVAAAAGIALVSALRALRNTGAQVNGSVVTFSLDALGKGAS